MCSALARMASTPPAIARMDGLQAAVQHLGKSGDFGDLAHRHTGRFESARAVPPVEMISTPRSRKPCGEFHHAGFVGDADECAFDESHSLQW